jgi:hypothetical protein
MLTQKDKFLLNERYAGKGISDRLDTGAQSEEDFQYDVMTLNQISHTYYMRILTVKRRDMTVEGR